ncbi:MAG: glutathione S-transferase C-terminal domain-containing protein [Parvularculaceae bacterium]
MELFYKPGSCSMASHIVLREIGAEFDLVKTDTKAAETETGADYRAVNPNGYVPALRLDSGDILTENIAILEYLASQNPASGLAPSGSPLETARRLEALSFVSSELHKAFSPFFSGATLDDAAREAALAKLRRRIGHIEERLADGRAHLLGADFSIADAYAFVVLNWTRFINFSLDAYPNAKRYLERIGARDSVKAALAAEGLA